MSGESKQPQNVEPKQEPKPAAPKAVKAEKPKAAKPAMSRHNRDTKIAALRKKKLTLKEIAKQVGLCPERVRQILKSK